MPHLSYEDPFAALAWLCRVFGFSEVRRFDRDDNLTARLRGPDGGAVMISGHDDDFKSWMRERAPRLEEATGQSWPLLTAPPPLPDGRASNAQRVDGVARPRLRNAA